MEGASTLEKKLEIILNHFNASKKLSQEPFTFLDELFCYRNGFAHRKIEVTPLDYVDFGHGKFTGKRRGDPKWYKEFGEQEQAEKTLRIIRESMLNIHKLCDPKDPREPWTIFGSSSSSQVHE